MRASGATDLREKVRWILLIEEDFLKLKDVEVPPQKELITEATLHDVELGPVPPIGMRLPIGLFEDDVRQFTTQKRVALGASLSHALKKSRAACPLVAFASANVPPSASPRVASAPIVSLHALVAIASVEAPLTVMRSEDDVMIIDDLIVAPELGVQPIIAEAVPRLTPVYRGCLPSPSTSEWMSAPHEQSSVKGKGKAPIFSALARSDASSHGYSNFEWINIDVQVPKGGSTFFNPQLVRELVHAILLPANRKSRRSQTLAD
ncbi:hypothetical protein COCNU_scaffold007880G000010 [Cocos nucifera]|nr:hypothetical protein [Cocos nucifera]